MCKFSIIVPCYNIYNNVESLFDMLTTENYNDYEVIFVDDCSKDDSYKKMLELKTKYSNYQVYQTPQNGGPGPARNFGLEKATGEYIVFCDSDDEFNVSCLNDMEEFLKQYPDADFAVSPHMVKRGSKETKADPLSKFKNGDALSGADVAMGNIAPWAKIYKADVIKQNEITFPARMTGEDACFILNYVSHAQHIYKFNMVYYGYVMNNASITHSYHEPVDTPTTFEVLLPLYEQYFPEIVIYKFIETHLMTKAKLMTAHKCKNKEIREWFEKETKRYPDWYEYTARLDRSLYRRALYKAIYKCDPIMIKFIMFVRSLLY